MAHERRIDPLPPGLYWVDVFTPAPGPSGGNISDFMGWLGEHADAVEPINAATIPPELSTGTIGDRAHLWMLFETSKPVPFYVVRNGKRLGFGFPTITERRDLKEEDTAHNEPTTINDMIEEALPILDSTLSKGVSLIVAAGAIWLGYKLITK